MEGAIQGQKRAGRSRARQAGLALLAGLGLWITVAGTYQVLRAALWPKRIATEFACRQGVQALLHSLEAAREQSGSLALGERQAVATFRAHLQPVWSQSHAILDRCRQDQDTQAQYAIKTLELLRYAEERAIRLSAVDLTQLRKTTPRLIQALNSTSNPKH